MENRKLSSLIKEPGISVSPGQITRIFEKPDRQIIPCRFQLTIPMI